MIKFYVLIQDKTEVLQSSLSRLNSDENISELVKITCFSLIFNFYSPVLFFLHLQYLHYEPTLKKEYTDKLK